MAIAYPFGLQTVTAGKSRTQAATFTLQQPRNGPAYVKNMSVDQPVFWSVNFAFVGADAQRFYAWFYSPAYLNRGRKTFTMPLRTEFGMVAHECQFMPDSLLDHGQDEDVHRYSATIRARRVELPVGVEDNLDLIASEYWPDAGLIDVICNVEWPLQMA